MTEHTMLGLITFAICLVVILLFKISNYLKEAVQRLSFIEAQLGYGGHGYSASINGKLDKLVDDVDTIGGLLKQISNDVDLISTNVSDLKPAKEDWNDPSWGPD